jgi:hypothetical protein
VRVQKILQAAAAVGLAESGYNLVAPLGYSTRDWYGSLGSSRGPVIETGLKPTYQFSPRTPGNK